MKDSVIASLYSSTDRLVAYCSEAIKSQPDLFPFYSTLELNELRQWLFLFHRLNINALESGDFEEVKVHIHKFFNDRIRSGFDPNELLRLKTLVFDCVQEILEHSPESTETLRAFYLHRANALRQVIGMYIAMLNWVVPTEERNTIDLALLELVL
jgi:hypothetical protein